MHTSKEVQLMILNDLIRYSYPKKEQLIQLIQQLPILPKNSIIEELQNMDKNHLNYLNLILLSTTDLNTSSIPNANFPWLTSGGKVQLKRLQSEIEKGPITHNTLNLNSSSFSNGPQTVNLGNQIADNSIHYYYEQNTTNTVYQLLEAGNQIKTATDYQQRKPIQLLVNLKLKFVTTLTKIWHLITTTISLLTKL